MQLYSEKRSVRTPVSSFCAKYESDSGPITDNDRKRIAMHEKKLKKMRQDEQELFEYARRK